MTNRKSIPITILAMTAAILWIASVQAGDPITGRGLDIMPGTCPNPVNTNSQGFLRVALVGETDFAASTAVLATLELARVDGVGGIVAPHEGPPGPRTRVVDLATPFEGEICDCHAPGRDGIDDLVLNFKTNDLVDALDLGSEPAGSIVGLTLSGVLDDGTPFSATDCIQVISPGS